MHDVFRFDKLMRSKNVDNNLREALQYFVPLIEMTSTAGDELSELGAWAFSDVSNPEGDLTLKWKPETKGYKTFDVLSVSVCKIYVCFMCLSEYARKKFISVIM